MPLAQHLAMSLGFFMSVLPAIVLVFMTLKEYEKYFEDKHFFFSMVLGLFAGIVSSVIYYWSIDYFTKTMALVILISLIIGIAIYEVLLIMMILLMKRFNAKYDITYYGVVLGGSFAGLLGMFSIYVFFINIDATELAIVSMVLLIITLPMIYISTGAIIGFGIIKGEIFKFSGFAILIKSVFNIFLILWFLGFFYIPPQHGWEWMFFGFLFAAGLFYYTYQYILPDALPEHLQRHRRRTKRKERKK
jgi:hypothetical protein